MKDEPMTREAAKRFLLGTVDDSERHRIESLFMTDPKTEETILAVEDELLEDYLEGSLSESEAAQFLERYGHEPRQQRRLRITASIREYALSEAQQTNAGTSYFQRLLSFLSFTRLRERRFIPIAASLIVLAIVAIWFIQWNNQRQREANVRWALQRELTELNSRSRVDQNQQTLAVVLPPVSLRSINSRPAIVSQPEYEVIELQLVLPQTQNAQDYTVLLGRVGDNEQFTVANLRQEKTLDGAVIKLRLPAKSLPAGHYEISLTGIPNAPTHQYDFVIGD